MMSHTVMRFDAVSEALPGTKWRARWNRSWPEYKTWFLARGGDKGPSRPECEQALQSYMPELVPTYRRLCMIAGNDDLAARFLSTWCPPAYLGGCSIAALSDESQTRLVRNYDLSPDLNEGLLLRSEWTGTPVMGMIEFLWGLSDGINARGLTIALAFGGRTQTERGFGVTTILRYILETCGTVSEALDVLNRIPSHMAYNLTLADSHGSTVTVELHPGGGFRKMSSAIATNHQHGKEQATRPAFTKTFERFTHLKSLLGAKISPRELKQAFLQKPLHQTDYANGMGTLFTAEYDPISGALNLNWLNEHWAQRLNKFEEGRRDIPLSSGYHKANTANAQNTAELAASLDLLRPYVAVSARNRFDSWSKQAHAGKIDWIGFGGLFVEQA